MQPTTRLKIKLWVFTAWVLLLIFVGAAIITSGDTRWQAAAAIGICIGAVLALTLTIVSGWLGYASLISSIKKEAHRGESHNDRP